MRKQAQFFALYIVVLTLFMCGIVAGLWIYQHKQAGNSLVSPKGVLEARDDLEEFETEEKVLIQESLADASADYEFGSGKFIESFRDSFLKKVNSDGKMKNYLFGNLYVGGRELSEEARQDSEAFFKNTLYPEDGAYFEDNLFHFSRSKIERFEILSADGGKDKIKYDVGFGFEFEKEYLITKSGDSFFMEAA